MTTAATTTTTTAKRRRKLRVLVITRGGRRQELIRELFALPDMSERFEPPAFSPGVDSRRLRCRRGLLEAAHEAGLLPESEHVAIARALASASVADRDGRSDSGDGDHERFWECLADVPVAAGRRGDPRDVRLHYSVELWRKAKTLNRGRAVLACLFAHLQAMKTLVKNGYDVVLEDNVRASPSDCAHRVWAAAEQKEVSATKDEDGDDDDDIGRCHLLYFGWLGSTTNLRWIYRSHVPRTASPSPLSSCRSKEDEDGARQFVFPFPTTEDIERDLQLNGDISYGDAGQEAAGGGGGADGFQKGNFIRTHDRPGGNPIWGCYAYWVSEAAYEHLMRTLRKDVGAILWKGKRARHYSVKPIDKILPRLTLARFGGTAASAAAAAVVRLPTRPAFFRAPMLASTIHTRWDPEFCESTELQLRLSAGSGWTDLWLADEERAAVEHRRLHGGWITAKQQLEKDADWERSKKGARRRPRQKLATSNRQETAF